MKMLKNLFASLLFTVLTFNTSAQVTHIISQANPNFSYLGWSTATGTLNVIAQVGDTLRFVNTNYYQLLKIFRKSPSLDFVTGSTNYIVGGYSPGIPYDYVVSVNDTAYAFNSDPFSGNYIYGKITLLTVTDIKDNNNNNNNSTTIKLFPNPANNLVQVTTIDKANLMIFSTTGQAVITATLNAGTTDIDVSQLTSGLYYVKVGDAVSKLIKE